MGRRRRGFVSVPHSWASRGLHLLHLGLILCCRVLPTQPHGLEFDTKRNACKPLADKCFYWFSYRPTNPDVCNCLTVVITPSVRKHCSIYLKQYCEGILQTSNLSSFNWAVWNNEKQWTIALVVQAPLCAERAMGWAPFHSLVLVKKVPQISW